MALSNLNLANVVKVAGGYGHSLAITTDGQLYSWGLNADGQLGDGTLTNKITPTQVGIDSDWVDVACGDHHSLALKFDGQIYAWGRNGSGQLGDGTTSGKLIPTLVSQSTRVHSKIAACCDRSFAITGLPAGATGSGSLYGWGDNSGRQINSQVNIVAKKTVPELMTQDAVLVAGNSRTTVAISTDNSLVLHGAHDFSPGSPSGSFGTDAYTPNTSRYDNDGFSKIVSTGVLSPFVALGLGLDFLLAITQAGELYGCTFKDFWDTSSPVIPAEAQTPIGGYGVSISVYGANPFLYYPTHNTLELIDNSRYWLRLSCGTAHALLTDVDGNVYSIGNNDFGQLGRAATGNDPNIVQMDSPANTGSWPVIGCGVYHSLLCLGS